ncbi:MAG: protein translocase subunit SecD, partial [Roseiflexaceae bacterium]|nr:protein translocase subunit SecD [Roseiflexaceae bacterium]
MRNRDTIALVFILLIAGLALWVNFAPDNTFLGRDVTTRLGLDLQGGTQVLLKAQPQGDQAITPDEMATAARIIEQRVNGLGVSEAVVQRSGNDRIIVELPGVDNPEQAVQTLRSTGQLEFIDPQGQDIPSGTVVRTSNNPNPPALQATTSVTATGALTETTAQPELPIYTSITKGSDLDTNSVLAPVLDTQSVNGGFAVPFAYRGESASSLEQWTSQNQQQPMCIVIDSAVQSCAIVQATLVGGSGQITSGSQEEATAIFNQLKYGALPVSLLIESSRTITASLGEDSLNASLIAGIIGLCAVMLFLILYYRLPGLIAVLVLLF